MYYIYMHIYIYVYIYIYIIYICNHENNVASWLSPQWLISVFICMFICTYTTLKYNHNDKRGIVVWPIAKLSSFEVDVMRYNPLFNCDFLELNKVVLLFTCFLCVFQLLNF